MNEAQRKRLSSGIYRIYWKEGGMSLAAVGVTRDGDRWLAPTNWVAPTTDEVEDCAKAWSYVRRVESVINSSEINALAGVYHLRIRKKVE